MDTKDDQNPFPRAPWKRLLEHPAAAPPDATDARIRAAARRALAPRPRAARWWLPVSLAASFVLAVLIVQSQIGTEHAAIVNESKRAVKPRTDATQIEREGSREAARPPPAAAAGQRTAPVRDEPAEDDSQFAPSPDTAAGTATTTPPVGGPERELKAASEMPREAVAEGPPAAMIELPAYSSPAPAQVPGAAAPTGAAPRDAGAVQAPARGVVAAPPSTPEAWYAKIEKLRAEGRTREADLELERLKEAWPGWLEQHVDSPGRP